MAIDFHAARNRHAYTGRSAHPDWIDAMRRIVDPAGKRVADVGCGGGIYTAAWAELGAAEVVGIDFSAQMVSDARDATRGRNNVTVRQGNAMDTGLAGGSVDIAFTRAVIHHLHDRPACFREAWRVLAADGAFIIQDRTPADVALPGSPEHIRGYFFEAFPRLAAVETARRPARNAVERELREAGFTEVRSQTLWETRKLHADPAALASDLCNRSGRSILHELSDAELARLAGYIAKALPPARPVQERDRWTVWVAAK